MAVQRATGWPGVRNVGVERVGTQPMGVSRSSLSLAGGLRLSLFGGFELRRAEVTIRVSASVQRLVAYVAFQARPSIRAHVAASLWMDTTEDRAMANLRSALWRLPRTGAPIVEVDGGRLSLSTAVTVDVHDLFDLARRTLLPGTDLAARDAERLIGPGEILPGWFDDWVDIERERFRQLRLHALERICEGFVRSGEYGRAIDAGLAAVAEEPLRESAHLVLVQAHLREGNRQEALRQFEDYRRLMHDELGLEPGQPMVDLVADLIQPASSHAATPAGADGFHARPGVGRASSRPLVGGRPGAA